MEYWQQLNELHWFLIKLHQISIGILIFLRFLFLYFFFQVCNNSVFPYFFEVCSCFFLWNYQVICTNFHCNNCLAYARWVSHWLISDYYLFIANKLFQNLVKMCQALKIEFEFEFAICSKLSKMFLPVNEQPHIKFLFHFIVIKFLSLTIKLDVLRTFFLLWRLNWVRGRGL